MMNAYKRALSSTIGERIREPRQLIQVVVGPRQVGKTFALRQALADYSDSVKYLLADGAGFNPLQWLEMAWNEARLTAKAKGGHLLVLDEIQKVDGWSDLIKRLWDEDTFNGVPLKIMLLGSSRLLLQKGLNESLMGRFEILAAGHWSFLEMRQAFGFSVEDYVLYGSYPGAAALRRNERRWRAYIRDAIVDPSISNDILQLEHISKPALLRQVFMLSCVYSAQILSYQKMLGQLQDAGNATTVAHYLRLLGEAGLVRGLEKYFVEPVREKASSPKLAVCNNALLTAMSSHSIKELKRRGELWGRLVESAAGAHLMATAQADDVDVCYWNAGSREVDYVLRKGGRLAAIEVKSAAVKDVSGMREFKRKYPEAKTYLVGEGGIGLEEFLQTSASDFL